MRPINTVTRKAVQCHRSHNECRKQQRASSADRRACQRHWRSAWRRHSAVAKITRVSEAGEEFHRLLRAPEPKPEAAPALAPPLGELVKKLKKRR